MATIDLEAEPPPTAWGVAVDEAAIGDWAIRWQGRRFDVPAFDYDGLPSWSGRPWFDFCGLSVSVVACLWAPEGGNEWAIRHEGRWLTDAPALFASFQRRLGQAGPQGMVEQFLDFSEEDAAHMFSGRGTLQMVPARAVRLREVAAAIGTRWGGSFQHLVDEAGGDGPTVVRLLVSTVPGYRDEWDSEAGLLAFNKLGHLATAMMSSRAPAPFARLDDFPVYADYMLPRVLRHMGILVYRPELAVAVGGRRLIEPGSRWELAIRWATLKAAHSLRTALNERGNRVTTPQLDYHLWWSSVLGPEADTMGEHHRTLTLAY